MQGQLTRPVLGTNGLSVFKRLLGLPFSKLGRALGGRPAPTAPPRPIIPHPVETLTFHNGAIFELYRGQPAREYLPLSGIGVVSKISFAELAEGLCEYRFQLNAVTDGTWRRYFQVLHPALDVRLDNKILVIICPPPALEATYGAVKEAFWQANEWYAEEREELIGRVVELDQRRHELAEMEENRKLGLQNHFDGLEL